ncbi:sialidase family protein [Snuella lapsa]|uniref:Exo-alpha-sialidase n=1 Tax=Snuella lapsa TaxID=870481 RepID=A0ABP6YHA0_9FLAO
MILKLKHVIGILLVISFSCSSVEKRPEVNNKIETFLFDTPVTKSCHAATLVEVLPNQLLAAWFGGSYEGAKDVGIYISFFKDRFWTTPRCVVEPLVKGQDTLPCWNPVLFKSSSNKLYLYYKVGKNPREWFGAMLISIDKGKTWSLPHYLPEGILGPIKNKPLEITPGVLLCGSSTESIENNEWRVHVERYTEANKQWERIPVGNEKGFDVIQPAFLKHSAHAIQMLCRSRHNKIVTTWSEDQGNTWGKLDSLQVANSNSGIDALTLGEKEFLLVNNPLLQGADWFNGRNVLDVEYSTDGIQWKTLFDLENKKEGQFSYPAIIQTSDRKIHILYTYNRENIKHVRFDLTIK